MFFFGKKKDAKQCYYGIFLKGEDAAIFIFEVIGEVVTILAHDSVNYTNGWENVVDDIDAVLSRLEKQTNVHPKQVIYFVYSYFVTPEGDLKEPYKSHIKSISRQLELKPLGYIECYEVVASYLEERDKAPLNVILVELDKHNVDICIYKASKKIIYRTVSRTGVLVDDLSTVFNEIKDLSLLPSRMVLYDSVDIDEESVKILAHKWDKEIFVQHPRVEVIKQENLYTQLAQVFIKQLSSGKAAGASVSVSNEPEETVTENLSATSQEAVVPPVLPISEPVVVNEKPPAVIEPQEQLGFVIDQPASLPKKRSFSIKKTRLAVPKMRFNFHFKSSGFILAAAGIALIGLSLFILEFYFHKASLVLVLPSTHLAKSMDVNNLDVHSGTISASVSDSATTTGKRDVGEKAIGEVTLHNFEDSTKSFSKGTQIEADGRIFILDQDVKIASASEVLIDGDPVKKPGKASVKITAKDIGPESNFSKDKRFKIDNLSTSLYFAVNESAFSGGSRKTVKTVAKKDIEDLKKILIEKAKKEVIDKVQATASNKSMLIDKLTQIKITSTKSSHEIAEEASDVMVTIDVDATYFAYDPDVMKQEVASRFSTEVPSDYKLEKDKVGYTIVDSIMDKDKVLLKIDAQAIAVKDLPSEKVADAIVGKSFSQVESVLKKGMMVSGFALDVKAPIPFMKSWTPFFRNNISVSMDTE